MIRRVTSENPSSVQKDAFETELSLAGIRAGRDKQWYDDNKDGIVGTCIKRCTQPDGRSESDDLPTIVDDTDMTKVNEKCVNVCYQFELFTSLCDRSRPSTGTVNGVDWSSDGWPNSYACGTTNYFDLSRDNDFAIPNATDTDIGGKFEDRLYSIARGTDEAVQTWSSSMKSEVEGESIDVGTSSTVCSESKKGRFTHPCFFANHMAARPGTTWTREENGKSMKFFDDPGDTCSGEGVPVSRGEVTMCMPRWTFLDMPSYSTIMAKSVDEDRKVDHDMSACLDDARMRAMQCKFLKSAGLTDKACPMDTTGQMDPDLQTVPYAGSMGDVRPLTQQCADLTAVTSLQGSYGAEAYDSDDWKQTLQNSVAFGALVGAGEDWYELFDPDYTPPAPKLTKLKKVCKYKKVCKGAAWVHPDCTEWEEDVCRFIPENVPCRYDYADTKWHGGYSWSEKTFDTATFKRLPNCGGSSGWILPNVKSTPDIETVPEGFYTRNR